ncbi:hypothetical protein EJ08DRAFT_702214 [Tothia fuscella]|uniref:Uncharacterized protein n=1 Tax=Tothia fuscella TaxID=1048955 RepID=A0A9P4TTR2_9PEZI|nr:hypothetical protein EJ08DRAFT_702214 [Tothia fuscella]
MAVPCDCFCHPLHINGASTCFCRCWKRAAKRARRVTAELAINDPKKPKRSSISAPLLAPRNHASAALDTVVEDDLIVVAPPTTSPVPVKWILPLERYSHSAEAFTSYLPTTRTASPSPTPTTTSSRIAATTTPEPVSAISAESMLLPGQTTRGSRTPSPSNPPPGLFPDGFPPEIPGPIRPGFLLDRLAASMIRARSGASETDLSQESVRNLVVPAQRLSRAVLSVPDLSPGFPNGWSRTEAFALVQEEQARMERSRRGR